MARFPAAFEDKTGKITRLTGELEYLPDPAATPGNVLTVQGDGSIAAAPGGGSAPKTAQYSANQFTTSPSTQVPNGQTAAISFGDQIGGDVLLDLIDPTAPTAIEAGLYAVTAGVFPQNSITAAGSISAGLVLDGSGPGYAVAGTLYAPDGAIPLTVVAPVPAGGTISLNGTNADGVNAVNFSTGVTVVKIS